MKVNKKYTCIVWLFIISFVAVIMASYPYHDQEVIKHQEMVYDENRDLEANQKVLNEIENSVSGIYINHLNKLSKEPIYTLLTEKEELTQDELNLIQQYVARSIDEMVYLNNQIDYSVESPLGITGEKEETDLQEMLENKEEYDWYIKFKVDGNGYLEIVENKTKSSNQTINSMINHCLLDEKILTPEFTNYVDEIKVNGVKLNRVHDVTMVFAVNNLSTVFEEENSYYSHDIEYEYMNQVIPFILTMFGITALLALILPYKKEKEIYGYRFFSRIPFEFWAMYAACIVIAIMSSGGLIYTTMNLYRQLIEPTNQSLFEFYLFLSLNGLMWFIAGFGIFFMFVLLKGMYHEGIWTYFKRHSLCVRAVKLIGCKCHQAIDAVTNLDLDDKTDRKILKAVALNYIVLCVISLFWVAGWFILLIYSVVLFYFARKSAKKTREDYQKFKNITLDLAMGNLDVDVDQDLGMFTPLKEDMSEIRKGFKEAVEKEVQSQRMKSELITNVSHDLKTPLTSIITYIDLLKKEDVTEEERNQYLTTLERNSARLKRLIEDLFDISKANSGNVKLNLMKIDIVAMMKQVEMECEELFSARNLQIRNNFKQDKILLELDPEKTYRIFENLLVNISKYALESTRVYIDMEEKDGYVEIIFKNISSEELNFDTKEIMERFTRGDGSRNSEGSGLGLSIANSFAQLQNGNLEIEIDGDLFKAILIFQKKTIRN